MEIRTLQYFVEIAREGNMTRTAERLHISQPTLSKQIKDLEGELGVRLFKRGSSSVSLTDEGILLRKRAEDILAMVDKTSSEFRSLTEITGGNVHIGCAETVHMRIIARAIAGFREQYPGFRYHLYSGDTENVETHLKQGLLDLALICEHPDSSRYNLIELPVKDRWGAVMRKDHSLASKPHITVDDLLTEQIICSRQSLIKDLPRWCGDRMDALNVMGTINLAYNGSVFVGEGLGIMLCFDGLVNTGAESPLCFRPLFPALETPNYIIWRKHQVFSPIGQRFVDYLTLQASPHSSYCSPPPAAPPASYADSCW